MSVEPRRIEAERLAVGDARRRVAIADEHQPAVEPALQVGLPLVAVGDVEQLHHVGAVLALARQRARDLLADRRAVVGKRHQPRLAALPASAGRAAARPASACRSGRGLRTRSGVQTFVRHSSFSVRLRVATSMSSIVCRRRMTRQRRRPPALRPAADGDCSSTPSPIRTRRRRESPRGRRPRAAAACGRGRRRRCSRRPGRRSRTAAARRSRGADRLDPVERAVERRPHQLGHAGVDDRRTRSSAVRGLMSMTRATQRAGRRRQSTGPARRRSAAPVVPDCVDERRHVVGRPTAPSPPSYEMPRPPPTSTYSSGDARLLQLAADAGEPAPRRARSGSSDGDLRADVHVHRDQLQRRPRRRASASSSRASSSGTPNLLIFRPVEMCGWLLASMSGLTRIATRAGAPRRARDRLDARQLAGRFDVDRLQTERHRALELGRRLADAGEDDVARARSRPCARRSISQIELASAALPSSRSSRAIASVEFAFSA